MKTQEMYDNSLIVFSADNGGPIYKGGSAAANNWRVEPCTQTAPQFHLRSSRTIMRETRSFADKTNSSPSCCFSSNERFRDGRGRISESRTKQRPFVAPDLLLSQAAARRQGEQLRGCEKRFSLPFFSINN